MRRLAPLLATTAAALCAAGIASAAAAPERDVQSTTSSPRAPIVVWARPGLSPRFRRSVSDYVTRCTAGGTAVRISARASRGARVRVAGRRLARGRTLRVRLSPGERFSIRVRAGGRNSVHHVRCLPGDFPRFSARRSGRTAAAGYLVTPSLSNGPLGDAYVAIFDSAGAPIWWKHDAAPSDAQLLANGNVAWVTPTEKGVGTDPSSAYEEHRLDGRLVRRIQAVGNPTDQHELETLPGGNVMVLAYRPRDGVDLSAYGGPADATVLDAEIQELTPSGDLVWSWNSKDHIGLEEAGRWYRTAIIAGPTPLRDGRLGYDVVHANSIEARGDQVVMSARHTDAIYSISRATGRIRWKLGGTARRESLRVLGDQTQPPRTFGGQHDARLLADGTLTLFDNGSFYERAPRAVRLRLDTRRRTARVLEQVRYRPARRSLCCGGARRLPGGRWVISWANRPLITEQTEDGSVRFRLRFAELFSYRAFPIPRGRLDREALRRGMDAMQRSRAAG